VFIVLRTWATTIIISFAETHQIAADFTDRTEKNRTAEAWATTIEPRIEAI
jgi:hypothetical protein